MNGLIETYRGIVQAWECDHLGHMNVQFYIARCSDAAWHLMHSIGLTPSYSREQQVGLAAVRYEVDFRRELSSGDLIRIETGILKIGRSSLLLLNRMWNDGSGEIAMEARNQGVCLDLATRKSKPLPEFVRARAQALLLGTEAAR